MQYHYETLTTAIQALATELENLSKRRMPKLFTEHGFFTFSPELISPPKNSMKIAGAIDLLNNTLGCVEELRSSPASIEEFRSLLASDDSEGGIYERNKIIITEAKESFSEMINPTVEDTRQLEEIFVRLNTIYDCIVAEIHQIMEPEQTTSLSL